VSNVKRENLSDLEAFGHGNDRSIRSTKRKVCVALNENGHASKITRGEYQQRSRVMSKAFRQDVLDPLRNIRATSVDGTHPRRRPLTILCVVRRMNQPERTRTDLPKLVGSKLINQPVHLLVLFWRNRHNASLRQQAGLTCVDRYLKGPIDRKLCGPAFARLCIFLAPNVTPAGADSATCGARHPTQQTGHGSGRRTEYTRMRP
jgi:hypothetical protein